MRIALLLIPVLLLTACGWNESDDDVEPWVVTGLEFELGESIVLGLAYTAPGGNGEWKMTLESGSLGETFTESEPYTCWRQARVTMPLPDCIRTVTAP